MEKNRIRWKDKSIRGFKNIRMTSKGPISRDKAEQSEIRNNSTEIKCPIATSSKWMSKWNERHCKKIKSLATKVQQTPLVQTETIISANRNHRWFKYPQLRKSPILQFRVKSLWMRTSFLLPRLVQGRVGDLGKVKETWGEVCWGLQRRVHWGWRQHTDTVIFFWNARLHY